MRIHKLSIVIGLCIICVSGACIALVSTVEIFNFRDSSSLKPWQERILNGKVKYWIDTKAGETFLHAKSSNTCSAIYKMVSINPYRDPGISWRWQVLEFPGASKGKEISDDYAARFYVVFLGFSFSSSQFIEYIWDEKLPVGTIKDSPYGKNIKQLVVRSGRDRQKGWASEDRNIRDDYAKLFKRPLRRSANVIALMCDSDNSSSSAESIFSDIKIRYKK